MSPSFPGDPARLHDLTCVQQTGLQDNLDNPATGAVHYCLYIFFDKIIILVFYGTDIDNHVNFIGTINNSLPSLPGFDIAGIRP